MKKLFSLLLLLIVPNIVFAYENYNSGYSDVETLIILDLSSSMILPLEDRTRFDVAVQTIKNLLDKYSEDSKVGLRIIGMAKPLVITPEVLFGVTQEDMCTLTSTPISIQAGTKSRIKRKINTLFPLGNTPIELTLRQSIDNDFHNPNSFKHIILITDGGENCGGDACSYIKEITSTRNDIRIDVIAIKLESDDFPLYNCITQQTNGQIININTSDDTIIRFNPPQIQYNIQQPVNQTVQNQSANNSFRLESHLYEIK